MLQDIQRGKTGDAAARIAALRPDILLLTAFDHDLDGLALTAFQAQLAQTGWDMPHGFAATPNTGLPSGLDLDRNGALGEPRDAHGYGRFRGQGGMAVLSRLPIQTDKVQNLSQLLWADLPDSRFPHDFYGTEVARVLRLSHTGHWILPIDTAKGPLWLMAFAATTPVFDGPEDRNGLRNADEIALWRHVLDGSVAVVPPGPWVILGKANIDPADGEGRRAAIRALLADPRLQDPAPRGAGGLAAANPGHTGDPALDTSDYDDPVPGNLRTSYILPSAGLRVTGAGVDWPAEADDGLRHYPVWVDLEM